MLALVLMSRRDGSPIVLDMPNQVEQCNGSIQASTRKLMIDIGRSAPSVTEVEKETSKKENSVKRKRDSKRKTPKR